MKIEELISTLHGYKTAGFEEIELYISQEGWVADGRTKTIVVGKEPGCYTIDYKGVTKEILIESGDFI